VDFLVAKQSMSNIDTFPIEDRSSSVSETMTNLHQQLNNSLQQLSPDRLKVLVDFAAYLAHSESEAATQELLAIPGLIERIDLNKSTPKHHYTSWRNLRADV
jgi:hypothetical protein